MLLALSAAAVTLLLAEGAVRILGIAPPPLPAFDGKDTRNVEDRRLLFENVPGSRRTLTFVDRPGGEPRVVRHTINRLGLRGRETTVPKPEKVFRIACLGDSFTFGYGVDDGETWPAQLEAQLRADPGGRRVEVLNFGVSGYDTVQEVRQLQVKVMAFSPDVVLLGWYFNDPAVHGKALPECEEVPFLMRTLRPRNEDWIATLRERSHLADLICDRLYRASFQRLFITNRGYAYRDDAQGWQAATSSLKRARDVLASRGIPFAVVLFPTLFELDGDIASRDAYRKVTAFCREIEVPSLDLTPEFAGRDLRSLWIHYSDNHANGEAYGIAARAVHAFLHEIDALPFECRR